MTTYTIVNDNILLVYYYSKKASAWRKKHTKSGIKTDAEALAWATELLGHGFDVAGPYRLLRQGVNTRCIASSSPYKLDGDPEAWS
jgi:hypothetical protein